MVIVETLHRNIRSLVTAPANRNDGADDDVSSDARRTFTANAFNYR
jgi:hypothetical protein